MVWCEGKIDVWESLAEGKSRHRTRFSNQSVTERGKETGEDG